MGKYVIQVLKGPITGKTFDVKDGLTFGRTKGDIILRDSSVSSLHAEIKIDKTGQILIRDKKSKNKIFMGEEQFENLVLEKNSTFKIGESEFCLRFIKSPSELWFQFIRNKLDKVQDAPMALQVFFKPVTILFYSGIQKDRQYHLSYGPRFFGRHSVDCPIFDKKCPEKAFVLIPKKSYIQFKTTYPDQVRINDEAIPEARLKHGDEIFIGDSVLKVEIG